MKIHSEVMEATGVDENHFRELEANNLAGVTENMDIPVIKSVVMTTVRLIVIMGMDTVMAKGIMCTRSPVTMIIITFTAEAVIATTEKTVTMATVIIENLVTMTIAIMDMTAIMAVVVMEKVAIMIIMIVERSVIMTMMTMAKGVTMATMGAARVGTKITVNITKMITSVNTSFMTGNHMVNTVMPTMVQGMETIIMVNVIPMEKVTAVDTERAIMQGQSHMGLFMIMIMATLMDIRNTMGKPHMEKV